VAEPDEMVMTASPVVMEIASRAEKVMKAAPVLSARLVAMETSAHPVVLALAA
jgi:hypothetical protein